MKIRSAVVLLALSWPAVAGWAAAPKVLDGPLADDGRFQLNGAQITAGVVTVETTDDDEWHEYLVTAPDKVGLKANGLYRLTYAYEVTKDLSGAEPFFYHLLRAGDAGDNDKGWEQWTAKAGEKGQKSSVVKLGNLPEYRLILGIHRGGGVKLTSLTLEDLSPAPGVVFAPYFLPADDRVELQFDAAITDNGVIVDATADADEWHEYLRTLAAQVRLAGGGKYKIGYDFKVVKALAGDGASFYHLVRTPDGMDKDKGMEQWTAAAGEKGHKEFTVELDKADGYQVILGIRFKGAIRIENLQIEDLAAKK